MMDRSSAARKGWETRRRRTRERLAVWGYELAREALIQTYERSLVPVTIIYDHHVEDWGGING